jgi:hypothetical protein
MDQHLPVMFGLIQSYRSIYSPAMMGLIYNHIDITPSQDWFTTGLWGNRYFSFWWLVLYGWCGPIAPWNGPLIQGAWAYILLLQYWFDTGLHGTMFPCYDLFYAGLHGHISSCYHSDKVLHGMIGLRQSCMGLYIIVIDGLIQYAWTYNTLMVGLIQRAWNYIPLIWYVRLF